VVVHSEGRTFNGSRREYDERKG